MLIGNSIAGQHMVVEPWKECETNGGKSFDSRVYPERARDFFHGYFSWGWSPSTRQPYLDWLYIWIISGERVQEKEKETRNTGNKFRATESEIQALFPLLITWMNDDKWIVSLLPLPLHTLPDLIVSDQDTRILEIGWTFLMNLRQIF